MDALPLTLLSFLVTLGILITVHEFGHFWVARRLGVKVLRFSIGFGTPLWRRIGKRDGTEYVVAALPLGGYVKMLDEREEPVAVAELDRAFNRQSLGVRSAIVVAGPLFNLLFAIAAFWLVFVIGDSGLRPLVGEVVAESAAAQGGFEVGDEWLSVDGRATPTWGYAMQALVGEAEEGRPLAVLVRDSLGNQRERYLPGGSVVAFSDRPDLLRALGVGVHLPKLAPVIGELVPGESAERAGLRVSDRVLSVDGQSVVSWSEFVDIIRERPGQLLQLEVERDGALLPLALTVGSRHEESGEEVGRIGAAVSRQEELYAGLRIEVRFGPWDALQESVGRTWDTSVLLLRTLGRLVSGNASLDNLGGPIAIAQASGKSAGYGVIEFLKFLASISIILAVMNLLPIPVLDGGHLLFFLIEAVKGSAISEEMMLQGQKIGVALLLALMVLVFYLDISRLFG